MLSKKILCLTNMIVMKIKYKLIYLFIMNIVIFMKGSLFKKKIISSILEVLAGRPLPDNRRAIFFFSRSPLTRLDVFPPSLSRCSLFNWISRIRRGDIRETIKKTRKVRSGGSRGLVKLRITSLIIIVRGSNAPLFLPYPRWPSRAAPSNDDKKEAE